MKTNTLKTHLLMLILTLCCGTVSHAAEDLITQQITIQLESAGTLPDKIGSSKKYKITNLKIIGDINGTDLRFIRDMAGRDYNNNKTSGQLSIIDLSEAKIVTGGDYYYYKYSASFCYYTENDKIGEYAFYNCSGLINLTIPSNVTSIGENAFEGCRGLTSLTIPSGVTSIGYSAFYGCEDII